MGFTTVKCPSCGANIELDSSREFGFCSFCGTKVVQDKIIVEHRGTIRIEGTATAETLLERAQFMLRDSDFASADSYFDRVLDIEPHCAEAYWGKLCCKLQSPSNEALCRHRYSLQKEPLYSKALEFADASLRETYQSIAKQVDLNQDILVKEQQEKVYRDSRITVISSSILALVFSTSLTALLTVLIPAKSSSGLWLRTIFFEIIISGIILWLFYMKKSQEFRAVRSFRKGEYIHITPKLWKEAVVLKNEKTGLIFRSIFLAIALGFLATAIACRLATTY